MAKYGTRYPVFAIFDSSTPETDDALPTYQAGKVLGKLASVTITLNVPEAEYYADDGIAEKAVEFTSGDGELECDNITDDNMAALYGATVTDGEVVQTTDDELPYFGLGFVQSKMVNAQKEYVAHIYPKCKAKPAGVSGTTKGANISFTGEPFSFTVFSPDYTDGGYHIFKKFDDADDAKDYLDTFFGIEAASGTETQPANPGTGGTSGT